MRIFVMFGTQDKRFDRLLNAILNSHFVEENDVYVQLGYTKGNYEKIYGQVDDTTELLALRNDFLSKEFWEFVLERLNDITSTGWDYISVSDEFLSVVKGLFKCNLSHDVRNILGNVHAALVKIKSFH